MSSWNSYWIRPTRPVHLYIHSYVPYVVFFIFFFPQSAQLYKVTTENYRQAADQVNAKFK